MVICIQCAMKADLENRPYQGEHDASILVHLARVHPDPMKTRIERVEMERRLKERVAP